MSNILSLAADLSVIRNKKRTSVTKGRRSFGMEAVPRGIRNNNPGNIEKNPANAWEGRVPLDKNTDERFEQFTSYAYGVRALIMLLRTYINSGKKTITAIFSQYAPPGENNTQQYINFVANRLGIDANAELKLSKNVLHALAQAIAKMENGKECISDAQFEEGWNLLSTEVKNSIAQSFAYQRNYSAPFYATGEHAILGEYIAGLSSSAIANVGELQPTRTYTVGRAPGVQFTYGQLITMGDFFENYDEMKNASVDQLNGLKRFIVQAENRHKNLVKKLANSIPGITSDQWKMYSPNYIDLALKNNSHFGPPDSGFTARVSENNKMMWERYHAQAINRARAGNKSTDLDEALTINAFGDHFLTDAFAAGHMFNKEYVMQRFLSNCFSGTTLNSTADKMLENVADGALRNPAIKTELGRWETKGADWEWIAPGKGFDLDTQTPKIFYRVLKAIINDPAGKSEISNLAAGAVHDFLNEYPGGLPVTNNMGKSWRLTGDSTLNKENIEIIQAAVAQSVGNLTEAVLNQSIPLNAFYKKVWDHVPNVNLGGTKSIVDGAIANFTNPASRDLVNVAVKLLSDELPTLLAKLESKGKIQKKK
jgi:hypothetical protein